MPRFTVRRLRLGGSTGSRKSSIIEFESEHRAGSKLNVQDARYKMLELHGSEALAWTVKDVEKVADSTPGDAPMEQMMLDFREPVEPHTSAKA